MNFFKSLSRSCYDLLWLKTARTRGVGKAWGYFFLFMLLATIATAIPLAIAIPFAAETLLSTLKDKVPADFSATITHGQLSVTGLSQPFVFKTNDNGDTQAGSFVVVVDTVSTGTLALSSYLEAGQSGVLVTKDKLEMYQNSRNQSRIQYWNKAGDGTLTKEDVGAFIAKLTNTKTLIIFSLIVFIFLYLGVTMAKLFGLMIISLVVYIIANLARRKIAYGDLFVTGLYAVTLPTVVAAVLTLAGVTFGNLYMLALLAFLLAIVFTRDPGVVPVLPTNEPPKPPSTP